MKAIMVSIKPKWVAKILNGEKTIEIRKTVPKCDLPIDVYIYCTKDNKTKLSSNSLQYYAIGSKDYKDYLGNWNGKVVAKFTLNKVEEIDCFKDTPYPYCYSTDELLEEQLENKSCLFYKELENYLEMGNGYAWHISNLVIFDKPKELWEFETPKQHLVDVIGQAQPILQNIRLTKAPQSWCYVEVD